MRKRLLKTLAFSALLCTLLTVSVFAEDAEITGNNVNFRSGPGTDYAIYECLPKGTVVTVTDRSDSEWYSVTYGDHSGFINSAYLSVSDAPVEQAPAEPEPVAVTTDAASSGSVNAMYVRMRSGPGSDYSILGEYNSGTALTVTGSSNGWYAIVINGQSGYMYADYVTVGAAVDSAAETPAPTPEPTPEPTPQPEPVQEPVSAGASSGHIQGDYVYFRSGPSTSYAIYDCLLNGTSLTITGLSGDWYAVTVNGQSGYVYSTYVVNEGGEVAVLPEQTPEPTPEPVPVQAEPVSSAAGSSAHASTRSAASSVAGTVSRCARQAASYRSLILKNPLRSRPSSPSTYEESIHTRNTPVTFTPQCSSTYF